MTEGCQGCLVPWRVYGNGVIKLQFFRKKCLIDLDKVFIGSPLGFLERRDYALGKPDYPRFVEKGYGGDIHFTMQEFAEASFGHHPPEEIAQFLEEHLTNETEQSDALVEKIRTFEDGKKITLVYPSRIESARGLGVCYRHRWFFHPLNFPEGELEEMLGRYVLPKERGIRGEMITGRAGNVMGIVPIGEQHIKSARARLTEKGILLYPANGRIAPDFDALSLIIYFHLNREGLKVVRV